MDLILAGVELLVVAASVSVVLQTVSGRLEGGRVTRSGDDASTHLVSDAFGVALEGRNHKHWAERLLFLLLGS